MKRLLIVEDELDIAETLKAMFEDEGYEVWTAGNGRQALELLEREPVDLVITDIMMPVMSGEELLEKLQEHPNHRSTPVMIISAGDARGVGEKFGCKVVPKPFDFDQLLDAVSEVLG